MSVGAGGSNYVIDQWNSVYQESLLQLGHSELGDLKEKIELLKVDPNKIAKPLRKTLEGKYTVRFEDEKWRLVIRICWNSHRIKLLYVQRRGSFYKDIKRLQRRAKSARK